MGGRSNPRSSVLVTVPARAIEKGLVQLVIVVVATSCRELDV